MSSMVRSKLGCANVMVSVALFLALALPSPAQAAQGAITTVAGNGQITGTVTP